MDSRRPLSDTQTSTGMLLPTLEKKPSEAKIPEGQLDFLESLFNVTDGIYSSTIIECKELDAGTKALYLERAVTEDYLTFLNSLDKLYQPHLSGQAATDNIELIRALKVVNDISFNNEVRYGNFGNRPALTHYLGKLGEINPKAIHAYMRAFASNAFSQLEATNPNLNVERIARIKAEAEITPETEWRIQLDLPKAQSTAPELAKKLVGHVEIIIILLQKLKKDIEEHHWELGALRKKHSITVNGKRKEIPQSVQELYEALLTLNPATADFSSITRVAMRILNSLKKEFKAQHHSIFSFTEHHITRQFIEKNTKDMLQLHIDHIEPAVKIYQENSNMLRAQLGDHWQEERLTRSIRRQLEAASAAPRRESKEDRTPPRL